MYSNARDLVVEHLALSRVETNPQLQANFANTVSDRTGAANRPRRAIEGGKEAVTGRVHFLASELTQVIADQLVMALQKLTPRTVTESRGFARCVDDVREENGRKDALGLRFRSFGSLARLLEEAFDLGKE